MNSHKLLQAAVVFCYFVLPSVVLADTASSRHGAGFRQATGDYTLRYPRDHGAHREFATEWWYFTGHLEAENARTYGFQLVFFRVGIIPSQPSRSAWAVQSLYLAHFAITDDSTGEFFQAERKSRGNFGDAGARDDRLLVWLGPYHGEMRDGKIHLRAEEQAFSLELNLESKKPLILHGEKGRSQKGPNPEDASYYTSFTRLVGGGSLRLRNETFAISKASAWMDQEFSSSHLTRETLGWDWFAIQLDNGEELMLYQLRRQDGTISSFSAGTHVDSSGKATNISQKEFQIEVLDRWTSPRTKVTYPSGWRLRAARFGIDLVVTPTVADQELVTERTTAVTYWEGRAKVEGTARGNAYVELVGYQSR